MNTFVIAIVAGLIAAAHLGESRQVPSYPVMFPRSAPVCPPQSDWPDFFPDPESCDHYYMCSNGVPYLMPCAPGTWWSQDLVTCVHAGTIPCEANKPPTTTTTVRPTTTTRRPTTTTSTERPTTTTT